MLNRIQSFETACGTDLIVEWNIYGEALISQNVIWTHYAGDTHGKGRTCSFGDNAIGEDTWNQEVWWAEQEAKNSLIHAEIRRREESARERWF
jgi:hypothetical protein